jgi:hypothetical protein
MKTVSKQIGETFASTVVAACFTALAIAANATGSPTLTPVNLTCLGLVNPQGLDAAHPGLSWIWVNQ